MEIAHQLQPALPTLGNVISYVDDVRLPAAELLPHLASAWAEAQGALALVGDTYRGQTVFVRINPYSGDIYGVKYTINPEGAARSAKKLAVYLHNIRTQGLRWKGSKAATRKWAADVAGPARSIDDLSGEVKKIFCIS